MERLLPALSAGEAGEVSPSVAYTPCRRKIEMTAGTQSRDDTPVGNEQAEHDLYYVPAKKLSGAFDCWLASGMSYYCR
jgi:hypothetical protein